MGHIFPGAERSARRGSRGLRLPAAVRVGWTGSRPSLVRSAARAARGGGCGLGNARSRLFVRLERSRVEAAEHCFRPVSHLTSAAMCLFAVRLSHRRPPCEAAFARSGASRCSWWRSGSAATARGSVRPPSSPSAQPQRPQLRSRAAMAAALRMRAAAIRYVRPGLHARGHVRRGARAFSSLTPKIDQVRCSAAPSRLLRGRRRCLCRYRAPSFL